RRRGKVEACWARAWCAPARLLTGEWPTRHAAAIAAQPPALIDGGQAMKFLWFHLMPYKELPDDFKTKHPSAWVDIHSSLFDPSRANHMYNEFLDELEFAAAAGFDAICCNEHHSNGYGLMPSPNLIASALARRTTETAICVLGNSLALYNPPTRVAEEF